VISKPVGKNNIMKHSSAENTQKRKAEEKKKRQRRNHLAKPAPAGDMLQWLFTAD
jgi:hypothetical protein